MKTEIDPACFAARHELPNPLEPGEAAPAVSPIPTKESFREAILRRYAAPFMPTIPVRDRRLDQPRNP